MELYSEQYGFLEELLGLSGEPDAVGLNQELCTSRSNEWMDFNTFTNPATTTYTSFQDYSLPVDQSRSFSVFNEIYSPFQDDLSPPLEFPPQQQDYSINYSLFEKDDILHRNLDICKVEPFQVADQVPTTFNMGTVFCPETKINKQVKKLNGQPSKNLMAERRRRKRLNDRLSLLRSVVPKISKMDRTSILGDTIDYMKELLERIDNLQEEIGVGSNQLTILKDAKPNEILVRNSPKFGVERRNDADTRIEIFCAGKPGLLLSTLSTLEALGLHIQHCVISCFNEFAMQASCLEKEQRAIISSEDVKQALFRNAGYGGRCL
ncbi:transcription factor bHLH93-like [Olea europaea subsp. europaea]|uniref:Transcription factor bHLH93-like n=1 Tax=Olea europaea subsp. europaea TaxID=158383 RepID=A0A8S0SXJ8_OLEEU|nr:transcription factor bHLH93-like [Olea europaea subsp. europaea]